MAFPFQFSAEFSSIEHPAYFFRQTDFFHLRDHIKRKYKEVKADRREIDFTIPQVFGIMSFSIKVRLIDGKIKYTIEMVPVLLTIVLLLFATLFLSSGSVILSLSIGAVALLVIYVFTLLIVNGMVRRVFEDFVLADMKRFQQKVMNPVCLRCGSPMKTGQTICNKCENSETEDEGLRIKYTFTPENKE